MSEPRNISPILDGFTPGECVSQHDGSTCYRATQNHSGKAFIVKVISLPASVAQLDALLMTGAFASPTQANAYFKEQARQVLQDVKVLRHMATVGGFVDYDCVQVVPSQDGKGFEVYLLSPVRQTLPQQLQREDLSQLDVLNMALDLCAALTVCRQCGYCYANLKPGNVFRQGQHYHIGDLGFIPVSQLHRAPLPEHYRSSYTPPELMDGRRAVGETADVYALGLILYQAYNGGILPGNDAVFGRLLLPPKYADYEMAEIILRACAPDPSIRWQGPEQMGRALMRYTQRNGLRNDPVVPSILRELEQQTKMEDFLPEPDIQPELDSEEEMPLAPIEPEKKHISRRRLPVRKERKTPRLKLSMGWIAIGILGVILIVELILSIWLLS